MSRFYNAVAALVFKDRNRELTCGGTLRAAQQGRRNDDTVLQMAQRFTMADSGHANCQLEWKTQVGAEEMPDFEDVCQQILSIDEAGFRVMHANALKAKALKRMTPWDQAILTYTQDLKEWLRCKEDCDAMVVHMDKPGPKPHLNDFKLDVLLPLKGVHFETRTGIKTVTFEDAILKPESPNKPPLIYAKTLIFVGKPGTGKSELLHALCRECCQRFEKTKYGMSASIDPFGIMTKTQVIKELGAIALYDFEMKAKLNQWLSMEEAKSLLYVKERAHIGARYHQAVFYELVPRFWAVNYGAFQNGEVDAGEWFRNNNLQGLELLVNMDEAALRAADSHTQAIGRRAVIFRIDEDLFDSKHAGATDAAAVELWQSHMHRATSFNRD